MASVAEVLCQHDPIERLCFQRCNATTNYGVLAPYFATTKKLRLLTVGNIHVLPPDVTAKIFENFGNSCSGLSLELFGEGENLFDISIIKNPASIKSLRLLCLLDLSRNFLENCKKFVNLEKIVLSVTFIDTMDTADVISFLPKLRSIEYTLRSKISGKIDKFFKNLEVHPSITEARLFQFTFSSENGNSIKSMLKNNTILKHIKIWNWICPEERVVNPLTDAIYGIGLNHALTSITIDTYLTNAEIEILGESLANKSNLTYISINSGQSADPVLSNLGTLKNLKQLTLTHGRISSGVPHICDCLKKNYPLESLRLEYTSFSYNDTTSMIHSLKSNTNLQEFNCFTERVIGVFPACEQLFRNNITLNKFEIRSFNQEIAYGPQDILQKLANQNLGMCSSPFLIMCL